MVNLINMLNNGTAKATELKVGNGVINTYYKISRMCVKLGVGEVYDDHCATDVFLDKVEYERILHPISSEGILILTDIDREVFRKDITINVFLEGSYIGSLKATKEILEALFVEKKQLWTDHGMADWISCIPEFSPYEWVKSPQIFTRHLDELWDIPSHLEWYDEGMYEAGIEPTDYLVRGHLGKEWAFVDDAKLEKQKGDKYNKILQVEEFEDWMEPFQYGLYTPQEVKDKIEYLRYKKDKDWIDEQMREHINEIQSLELYKISEDGQSILPLVHASRYSKFSPLWDEYVKVVEEYKERREHLMVVYSAAGAFIADERDKVWNVKVPENKKGLFIGKKGANIKALSKEYKVRINVL